MADLIHIINIIYTFTLLVAIDFHNQKLDIFVGASPFLLLFLTSYLFLKFRILQNVCSYIN